MGIDWDDAFPSLTKNGTLCINADVYYITKRSNGIELKYILAGKPGIGCAEAESRYTAQNHLPSHEADYVVGDAEISLLTPRAVSCL